MSEDYSTEYDMRNDDDDDDDVEVEQHYSTGLGNTVISRIEALEEATQTIKDNCGNSQIL